MAKTLLKRLPPLVGTPVLFNMLTLSKTVEAGGVSKGGVHIQV